MPRLAHLLALTTIPSALWLAGCSDDCTSAFDCKSAEVCYKGTCTAALSPDLACNTDDDCGGMPAAGMPREYLCLAGRCRDNPGMRAMPAPDASVPDASDAGPVDTGPMDSGASDAGMPDSGLPPDSGITVSTCSFPTVEATATPDESGPLLTALALDPAMPVPGTPAAVRLTIVEGGCGLRSVEAELASADLVADGYPGDRVVLRAATIPARMGAANYEVSLPFTMNACWLSNVHRITRITLEDHAGNVVVYTYSQGQMFYGRQENGANSPGGIQVAPVSFTPTGMTGRPILLTAVTATVTAGGVRVDVTANAPSGCDLREAEVTLVSDRGQRLVGRATNGATAIGVEVPACARSGTWRVASVALKDATERVVVHTANGANFTRGVGMDGPPTPGPVTLSGGSDTQAPNPTLVVGSGSSTPGQGLAASVQVYASDDACGIGNASVVLRGTSANGLTRDFRAPLTAGPDGDLRGCVAVPECAPARDYTLQLITLPDLGGHTTTLNANGMLYDMTFTSTRAAATLSSPPPTYMRP